MQIHIYSAKLEYAYRLGQRIHFRGMFLLYLLNFNGSFSAVEFR